jgi:hypothetical protein
MLPAGTYAAVVSPVETQSGLLPIQFGPGTEKSPFTAVLSFEILRGPQAGQHISAFLYFGEKSVNRSMESLRVCGFKGDDLDKFVDQTPDQEVQIVVEHETYDGQTRAKIKWINSPSRGFVFEQPLDQKNLRMFSAQMKGKLKTIKEVAGKKAEREPPTPAAASEEGSGWSGNDQPDPPPADDLPF